jgi:hypothetical protein
MKRRTQRIRKNKQKRTRKRKHQRGGNIMNSVKPPKGAFAANPTETDGGYKFEEVSTL